MKTDDRSVLDLLCGRFDEDLSISDWDKPIQIDRTTLYDVYRANSGHPVKSRRFSGNLAKLFAFVPGWADNWKRRSRQGPSIFFYKFPDFKSCRATFTAHCKTTEASLFGN